jgi:hypothetical protein
VLNSEAGWGGAASGGAVQKAKCSVFYHAEIEWHQTVTLQCGTFGPHGPFIPNSMHQCSLWEAKDSVGRQEIHHIYHIS